MSPDGTQATRGPVALEYISVESGQVSGKVEPYEDPGCKCIVQTEFEGAMLGDTIEGTYTTRLVGMAETRAGWWSVQRL